MTPNERGRSFRWSTALAASVVFVFAAGAARTRAPVKFVVIVLGQSNALGRAPKPVYGAANGFAYRRTRIWATDIHEPAGVNSGPPFTAARTRGWQPLDPGVPISYGEGNGNHGLEPWLAYLFERNHPDDELFIIKLAYGGAPLTMSTAMDWNPSSDRELYWAAVNEYLKPALESAPLRNSSFVAAGLWIAEGESDAMEQASAETFAANLAAFFAHLTADVPATARFPRFLQQTEKMAGHSPLLRYSDVVRAAEHDFAAVPANHATLVDIDAIDCYSQDDATTGTVAVHFSARGFYQLANVLYPLMFPSARSGRHP